MKWINTATRLWVATSGKANWRRATTSKRDASSGLQRGRRRSGGLPDEHSVFLAKLSSHSQKPLERKRQLDSRSDRDKPLHKPARMPLLLVLQAIDQMFRTWSKSSRPAPFSTVSPQVPKSQCHCVPVVSRRHVENNRRLDRSLRRLTRQCLAALVQESIPVGAWILHATLV